MPEWHVELANQAFIGIGLLARCTSRRVEQHERRESPPIDLKPRAEKVKYGAASREEVAVSPNSRATSHNSRAHNRDSPAFSVPSRADSRKSRPISDN